MNTLPSPRTNLTAKQIAFAENFVSSGGKAEQSAVRAGYATTGDAAHVRANELLRHEGVLAMIRHLCDTRLRASVAMAAAQLEHLAQHARGGNSGDAVKLKACEALLDRGGMLVAKYAEVHHVHHTADLGSQLRQIGDLLIQLGPEAGVRIDLDQWNWFCDAMKRGEHGHLIDVTPKRLDLGDTP